MAGITMENSVHAFLNKKIHGKNTPQTVLPVNTSDDVIINDDGDVLSEFIFTMDNSKTNPTEQSALCTVAGEQVTISDACSKKIFGN